ncbi:MAG: GNAT family N-acetyltransferase [Actinomycetota bacterium]
MTEIRKLDADDVDLLDAAIRVLKDHSSPAPEMFLRDPRAHAFVAIESDEVVGCAYGYELFRPDGFWMMLLYELGVTEPFRKQGLGRDLLDVFVAFAKSKGHSKMWLFIDAGNAAARRLYEGAGGERPDDSMGYWWVFE